MRLVIVICLVVMLPGCLLAGDFEDGFAAYNAGNFEKAFEHLRKSADQGFVGAQYNLGVMYRDGQGVAQDDTEAVKWFRKSADQGYAEAQYSLGVMYRDGQGVAQDDTEAAKWYRNAADQGFVKAQNNLGVMYDEGEGVTQDYVLAHMWFNLAAAGGDEKAGGGRDIVAKKMTPAQIEKAQDMAREKAAEIEKRRK